MTATRVMAVMFFGLACILIFATPDTRGFDTLGDPGPGLLPRITGLCMALLAMLLFLQEPERQEHAEADLEKPLVAALSVSAIPAFYLAFALLGYTLAVGLYLVAAFCLLGSRSPGAWTRYVLAAAAFSLTSGMAFTRLLDLPLPGVYP